MYYPQSQIKPNQYTNGDELFLKTTKQSYKGYFFEVSNGDKYTGKDTSDKPNIQLIPPPPGSNEDEFITDSDKLYININYSNAIETFPSSYKPNLIQSPRIIPQYNPNIPNQNDIKSGKYNRYFCKKTNELKYKEISKETYTLLESKSPDIAWDLYIPQVVIWVLTGDEKKVYLENEKSVNIVEDKKKWYGFSIYLKNDYLKYYQK
jgi:hypothetical protein